MMLPGVLFAGEQCSCSSITTDANIPLYADECYLNDKGVCDVYECKPNSCFVMYYKSGYNTCLPGGARNEYGWCVDDQVCNCDPADVGATRCVVEGSLFCKPKECKENYCLRGDTCIPGIPVGKGKEDDPCDCSAFNIEHGKKCVFKKLRDCLICTAQECDGDFVTYEYQCVKDRKATLTNVAMRDRTTNPEEYTIDPREYVDWGYGKCPEPYNRLLRMTTGGTCTAEYIAPDTILTAQHCVVDNNNDIFVDKEIWFIDCNNNRVLAYVKEYGDNDIYKGDNNKWGDHSIPVDWVLLRVADSKFYNNDAMFDLMDMSHRAATIVDNAGWGAMPILSDIQIQDLRQSFTEFATETNAVFRQFDEHFITAYDEMVLKVHKNCQIRTYHSDGRDADYHSSTCYTWGGNSGGPYYANNKIWGIVSGGVVNLPDQDVSDMIVPTAQYISQEQKNCESVTGTQWHKNVCVCEDIDKEWKHGKCECKDDNYIIGVDNRCISQAQKDCEGITGAKWDNGGCLCVDKDKELKGNNCECKGDYITGDDGKCTLPPKSISPAQLACEKEVAKQSGAKWNGEICECSVADTSWNGEKCVCSDPAKTVKDGECVVPTKPVSPEQKSCERDIAVKSGAKWNGEKEKCECSVADTSWNGEKCICSDPEKTVQDGSCKTSPRKRELDDVKKDFMADCLDKQKLKTMSDYEFLTCLGRMARIKKLEEQYKKAKEREISFSNRMLGGLTMAATGLGGMQLAQGLAEQSADAAAARDMQAYLATFKCKVGDKWYSGGTTNAETGGANQLTSLYQEYVDLAADVKTRKEALGLKPGIESEVKLDKAYTGLYDNAGKGIENGTYASLYRASRGNENDINKLNEQKETSGTRVKGGGIAAGGGALAGVAGNLLINHTGDDTDGDSQSIDAETVMKVMQSMQK